VQSLPPSASSPAAKAADEDVASKYITMYSLPVKEQLICIVPCTFIGSQFGESDRCASCPSELYPTPADTPRHRHNIQGKVILTSGFVVLHPHSNPFKRRCGVIIRNDHVRQCQYDGSREVIVLGDATCLR
jgi:hypothetical protein